MKRRSFIFLSAIIISGLAAAWGHMGAERPTQSTEVARLLPQFQTVKGIERFTLSCMVENVEELVGLDIQIMWNATVLQHVAHSATLACLNPPTFMTKNDVDADAGTYWLAASTLNTTDPGFDGNGEAFNITFQTLPVVPPTTSITTAINFTSCNLGDPWGYVTTYDAEVTVQGPLLSVAWVGTSPYPLTPSSVIRVSEPVAVAANVSDSLDATEVTLSYTVDGGAWWNTTMAYNATSGLWVTVIPGQPGGSTIQLYAVATDSDGGVNPSYPYSYNVQSLLVGDVDGDGDVDIFDIVKAAVNYGKTLP